MLPVSRGRALASFTRTALQAASLPKQRAQQRHRQSTSEVLSRHDAPRLIAVHSAALRRRRRHHWELVLYTGV